MADKPETSAEPPKPTTKDNLVITHHAVTINGQDIRYTVTAGTIVLKEETTSKGEKEGEFEGEKAKAEVFFIAYSRDDGEKSNRPLTFSFNGGPGSSSVWLHLGLLGPKRVQMRDTENTPPPYTLVENEYSLLDLTDLVFIDPISTGYSRVVPGEKAKDFHGFKKDIESVGDFIRLYTSRQDSRVTYKSVTACI
jgi:carboxypeptidase C (cathepsin A)